VGFKVPRFAEQLTRREFRDLTYGVFSSFYHDEQVIHILRDVLDVVGSMLKLKAAGETSWLEMYGVSILQTMIRHPDINGALKRKYTEVEEQGLPLHLVGALYWEIKNHGYFDLQVCKKPVMSVKYEHLVTSPEYELRRICRFLGIDWHAALLNHPAYLHGELDQRGRAIGETDPQRSIDANSVGGYRAVLTEQQIDDITSLTREMSHRLTCDVGGSEPAAA